MDLVCLACGVALLVGLVAYYTEVYDAHACLPKEFIVPFSGIFHTRKERDEIIKEKREAKKDKKAMRGLRTAAGFASHRISKRMKHTKESGKMGGSITWPVKLSEVPVGKKCVDQGGVERIKVDASFVFNGNTKELEAVPLLDLFVIIVD